MQFCQKFILKGLFVLAVLSYLASSRDIYVDPNATNSTDSNVCWTGTAPCKSLELGLSGLQQSGGHATLWISAGNYSINSTETNFKFENINHIEIVGLSADESLRSDTPPVLVLCNNNASELHFGLTFINSNNITVNGIGLIGCGALHNSTSKNFTLGHNEDTLFSFSKFNATLYFLFCTDITLKFVHINDSFGVGAVFYSTVGNNKIDESLFYNNNALEGTPGGGGLYIEFSYCVPSTNGDYNNCSSGSNVPPLYAHNAQYLVTHTVFDRNNASLVDTDSTTFILPQKSEHLAFGRGGGISVFFKGNATNNTITISNCALSNNVALWGAGLFVEYQDMSLGNTITIEDSHIVNNSVLDYSTKSGTGGGGSRVGFIFFDGTQVSENTILFKNVNFDQNRAYFGGGLSFYVAREQSVTATNKLLFYDCMWISNVARVGAGVDLAVWHPVSEGAVVKPLFSNCTFSDNNADYASVLLGGNFVGLGTFYSDSIPTEFDFVNFTGNAQTALAAVGTGIHFHKNSEASFVSNVGRNGGAIALMGYAFIEVAEGAVLNFVNNSADLKGGAIYGQSIGEHDLISSRNCFIRYSDIKALPEDWNATFNFVNNSAKNEPNAIFVTSLLTCLWGGASGSANNNDTSKVFCWNEKNDTKWNYDHGNCSKYIETSPAYFKPNNSTSNHTHSQYDMTVIPGRRKILPFLSFDDKEKNVTPYTVLVAQIDKTENNSLHLDNSSVYISDNSLEVHGFPGSEGVITIETVDPRVVSTKVNITIEHCPPGMILSSNTNYSNASCTCGTGDRPLYNNVITCKQEDYTTFLQRGSWIGKINNSSNELYVGQCPFCAGIESEKRRIPISNIRVTDLDENLCGQINRTGILCAHCKKDYGPAVNSEDFQCMKCTEQDMKIHWFYYLLTEFLPITIFFFIVVLFNISVTSGPANAFVFFAQMVTTAVNLDGDGLIRLAPIVHNGTVTYDDLVRVIPYGFWNLNFFRPFLPSFCLSSRITTLQLISTGYITAFYPLILVAVFYMFSWLYSRGFRPIVCLCRPLHACFARVTRIWDVQKSIVHALATFLVLSYAKFTQVSFFLLKSTPLAFSNGSTASLRLYYAGDIDFGSPEHVPFLVPAILVLGTFVAIPPIILIAPSIIHILQKFCRRTPDLCGGAWFSQFLNAFHGCYKDGTGGEDNKYDCRWFAGLYFLLRVLLLGIFAFTGDWFLQSMLQLAVCVGANWAFVVFRPYKNDLYNKVDAGFFNLIALLCCISLQNYYGYDSSLIFLVIQHLLFILPLVYISVVVIHYLWSRNKSIFRNLCQKCFRKSRQNAEELVQNDDDFFQDAEEAGRFGDPESEETQFMHPRLSVQLEDDENHPLLSPRGSTNSSGDQNKSQDSGRSSYGGTHTSAETQTPTFCDGVKSENSEVGQLVQLAEEDSNQKRKSLFFTQ